jgi:hypothetical protein
VSINLVIIIMQSGMDVYDTYVEVIMLRGISWSNQRKSNQSF